MKCDVAHIDLRGPGKGARANSRLCLPSKKKDSGSTHSCLTRDSYSGFTLDATSFIRPTEAFSAVSVREKRLRALR